MPDAAGLHAAQNNPYAKTHMKRPFLLKALVAACVLGAHGAHATGVAPETSVVIVNEADGEATINVKNTDASPVLLYTSLMDVPEDPEKLLVVTPPMARVEPAQSQLVRFILDSPAPLKTERLKRVVFEGIPNVGKGKNEVKVTVRQNVPLIIHPKDLAPSQDPWTLLKWSVEGDALVVRNDSPYVVRLDQAVQLMPQKTALDLPKPYVLPGETLTVKAPQAGAFTGSRQVRLSPATVYGYSVDSYDAPLGSAPPRAAQTSAGAQTSAAAQSTTASHTSATAAPIAP
jgi:P pilus assembly chaperone PapD